MRSYRDDTIQCLKKDGQYWMYNATNDKMIVSNQSLEKYIDNDSDSDTNNPLFNFLNDTYNKKSILNIVLVRFLIKVKKDSIFQKILRMINKSSIFIAIIVFNIVTLVYMADRLERAYNKLGMVDFMGLGKNY